MNGRWGSDLVAEAIAALGFRFVTYNPGASWRGLHDSLVNHLGGAVELVLALHEEHAVAMAHGWTKVTGEPALALVHSNVGLLHASMAVYNAWVDRAPVVLLGATGAMDAARRRPWIEWIHTVQDQAQIVRPFTKWDDQPASASAAVESLAHAASLARTPPCGPVYVCLDVTDQEMPLPNGVTLEETLPRAVPRAPRIGDGEAAELAAALAAAERPLLLIGRTGRATAAWADRVALVERTGARVVTDVRTAAAFPTAHPAHTGQPGFAFDEAQRTALGAADLLIAFDWIDPATAFALAARSRPGPPPAAFIVSVDHLAHRGWTKDGFALPPFGRWLAGTPDDTVVHLLAHVPGETRAPWPLPATHPASGTNDDGIGDESEAYRAVAAALEAVRAERPITVTRLPLGWPPGALDVDHPLSYLGRDGGEGLASGPGMAVGAALALGGGSRLPVAVLGDGDLLMGLTALWTAASRRLPLLVVVWANGVYGNDVVHQERVARERGRPVENRFVGQTFTDPPLDFVALARGLGALHAVRADALDPELPGMLRHAAARAADDRGLALVEVATGARSATETTPSQDFS